MPPRKRAPSAPTPIESIEHQDKRANNPTADAAEAYGFEADAAQVVYPRDPALDPQLVWRGKDASDSADLVVDAPPIYQQEKIDPRVLIENLRRTATSDSAEPELALFESFDGLDELDVVDFYRHQANWSNRMVLGDSLQVMASLAERESLRGQVQMVYLDPPYGIKFGSNWQSRVGSRDVKDGKLEDAAREAEQIKAFRDTWELGIHSYLSYLRDRLLAARDLLTESGSCFVQIGDENVHLVRSLMDEVFGSENFISLITFTSTTSTTGRFIAGTSSHILWFGKSIDSSKYRALYLEKVQGTAGATKYDQVDSQGRPFTLDNLTSPRVRSARTGHFPVQVGGKSFLPRAGEWKTHRAGMERLVKAARVQPQGNTLRYVRYLEDFSAVPLSNVWPDAGGVQSRTDPKVYVVQSSTSLVARCMLMSTDPGDLVLDPTCGSGTTATVAEQWGRRWITIDTSRVALALARQRLMGARYPYYKMTDTADIRQGFDYERVQHITLKSIANNPDIREGMSQDDIDAAIKRHADFEVLYDKPKIDNSKIRVTGPFTVESLSPHRSLAFAGGPDDPANRETLSEQTAAQDVDGTTFEQSILDNLTKAGIQNGRRDERIAFTGLDTFAGSYIQAVGEQVDAADEAPTRIGIAIGPQYGTVSPTFIKSAAKEAIGSGDIDLLCVLGFAFDSRAAEVTEVDGHNIQATDQGFANVADERRIGRLKVLLVRMNVDLLMGEELKKTGAGNLFTVFGEPDIELRESGDQVVVEIRGVDVYDPTTGEVRSDDTSQIALWMIDTNYNEEAFFVRECYFTGGNDPYKRLKAALKSEIDADAWASLYRTESRPFDRPETGKIAVKVINDYGDEVMKVFDVGEPEET